MNKEKIKKIFGYIDDFFYMTDLTIKAITPVLIWFIFLIIFVKDTTLKLYILLIVFVNAVYKFIRAPYRAGKLRGFL